jgi:hypothetical protein
MKKAILFLGAWFIFSGFTQFNCQQEMNSIESIEAFRTLVVTTGCASAGLSELETLVGATYPAYIQAFAHYLHGFYVEKLNALLTEISDTINPDKDWQASYLFCKIAKIDEFIVWMDTHANLTEYPN